MSEEEAALLGSLCLTASVCVTALAGLSYAATTVAVAQHQHKDLLNNGMVHVMCGVKHLLVLYVHACSERQS